MIVKQMEGGKTESRIVTAMIVDQSVLSRIAARWQNNLFSSHWANKVGSWCARYYNKHQKAPGKHIESLFEHWSEKEQDKNTVELIQRYLSGLSDQYESLQQESNSDYLIDLAEKHFKQVGLERLSEEIKNDLDVGDVDKADRRRLQYKPVEISASAGIDVFQDFSVLEDAFAYRNDSLIAFQGALGKHINVAMERDAFVVLMGPSKRGKTWWLMRIALQAVLQRRKVAFFEVGDLSQRQMIKRFGSWACKHPISSPDGAWPLEVKYPTEITRKDYVEAKAEVDYVVKAYSEPLSYELAKMGFQRVVDKKIKSKECYLKLACYPNSTISVRGIEEVLGSWDRQGWTPDVVVIDYADILAPIDPREMSIERVDTTWKALRALSQHRHCLLLTASQTSKESFDAGLLSKRHGTENMRKFAHLTAVIGLNQQREEKDIGVQRLNIMDAREFEFNPAKCVYVAGCLAVANPAILSCF